MRQKLSLFLMLFITMSVYAQTTGFSGNIVDDATGLPIPGVHVIMRNQNVYATSNVNGEFIIRKEGIDVAILDFIKEGYEDAAISLIASQETVKSTGTVKMISSNGSDNSEIMFIDESQINEEDGSNQTIGSFGNASDDVYLKAASFNFSAMRFNLRGYSQNYSSTYINGVNFNDGERGRFNFSMLGGLNSLFKNKDVTKFNEAGNFGFGDFGGATNIITRASGFAKGTSVNIGATNRSYVLRGMVNVASGLLANGWAFNAGLIYRWSEEGAWDGTFYNSFGYYAGAEKVFNRNHRLSLITFGAPTQRGQQSATTQEAYDLKGSIYYNPNWGYHNGEKRNARVVSSYDPTAILSYEWAIDHKQKVNIGIGSHYNRYSSTALNFYNAPDPRPDYYRNMPGYQAAVLMESIDYGKENNITDAINNIYQQEVDRWVNSESQIDWFGLYQANYANNSLYPDATAKYSLEERHDDLFETTFNATYVGQVLPKMKLISGIEAKYSKGMHYKTMKDLLGGKQWIDIDQFSERDNPTEDMKDIVQNDLNNPNRVIREGDKFGYNYDMHVKKGSAFITNEWGWRNFDLFYSAKATYTSFQREGHMRNGRAEYGGKKSISFGKGKESYFIDPSFKVGFSYKPNGRNRFSVNGLAESRAPLANNAYISPRIKDDQIKGLTAEKILSYDINYEFKYRRIKGRISAYQTNTQDGIEIYRYYNDGASTFVNHTISDVNKRYRGVEAAATFKINGNFSATIAGTWSDNIYTDDAMGTISSEDSSFEESENVNIKNKYLNAGPQIAGSFAINYFHSKMWFAEAKISYFDKNYLGISPIRLRDSDIETYKTAMNSVLNSTNKSTALKRELIAGIRDLYSQEELNSGYMVDLSVGKVIYLNNRAQSLNINLSCNNVLNNKKMITGGYQQGRVGLDASNVLLSSLKKFPNKYYYAQGFNVFLNAGYKF